MTKSSSSLIDHLITKSIDRCTQYGVISTGLSDHFYLFGSSDQTKNGSEISDPDVLICKYLFYTTYLI
jgi:hypothetical protein